MDIDIDVRSDFDPLKIFKIVPASTVENGMLKKHIVGNYFQNIPVDKVTGFAAIPYTQANHYGYYKIDMLHLSVLDIFESKDEINQLIKREPDWSLLEDAGTVQKCFHIGNHFELVNKVKPKSVIELADVLALIRPKKIKLIDKYLKNREEIRPLLYDKQNKSDLRKSHAIPYALLIVLQLHLIKAKIL